MHWLEKIGFDEKTAADLISYCSSVRSGLSVAERLGEKYLWQIKTVEFAQELKVAAKTCSLS